MMWTGRSWLLTALAFAFATTVAREIEAQQPGLGGNIGRVRAEAALYRSNVRTILTILIEDLGSRWDSENALAPAAFYSPSAKIVLGPIDVIEGRAAIRKAFAGRLGDMHGVQLTMDDFDMSGEVAFVRGTMRYDLVHAGGASTKETATFAMLLWLNRDEWLIQSHTIGGLPVLPGEPAAEQ